MTGPEIRLGGRYRLQDRIGSGGMGDVWRCVDETLDRIAAIKIVLRALLDQPGFIDRFRVEARTMAAIKHPGVVSVYDFGTDPAVGAYLVMEYIEGEALSKTLARYGRITAARTMSLVAQAADALHAAHSKGIVHRDVKPGNLLVRPNATLVLTDFGIALSNVSAEFTAAGVVFGAAAYMSPEHADHQHVSPRSDIYSLGVVAYECLAGRRPFEGSNPVEIAMHHLQKEPPPLPADVPASVRAIVKRAMAKNPDARWRSAAELAQAAWRSVAELTTAAPQ